LVVVASLREAGLLLTSAYVKTPRDLLVVLVTAPDRQTARHLAQAALKERLIACANLVPGIESHYVWQGKVETGAEVLMVLKTNRARVKRLEKLILANHPYDTPEFVVLTVSGVTAKYLRWWQDSVSG
jgi:periplasmic divalent cation tolerance protein